MGQKSLTPQLEKNSLTPLGNNNLNFQLTYDQVTVYLKFALAACCPNSSLIVQVTNGSVLFFILPHHKYSENNKKNRKNRFNNGEETQSKL